MNPIWETVENARTFLMSCWDVAIVAATKAVAAPTTAMVARPVEVSTSTWLMRHSRYTPAVTIVAAWMSADTGVGPSIASGSQLNSGIWADLPAAAKSSAIVTSVTWVPVSVEAPAAIPRYVSVCRCVKSTNIATSIPTSPIRL